jgi:hypothetical protein
MESPRGMVDTNDERAAHEGPTREKTEVNHYPLHCETCGGLFYVDEATMRRVETAVAYDPSDNPFRCDECEAEDADEGYGR